MECSSRPVGQGLCGGDPQNHELWSWPPSGGGIMESYQLYSSSNVIFVLVKSYFFIFVISREISNIPHKPHYIGDPVIPVICD